MNYKLFLIVFATIAVLLTSVPSKAFEDTFQYYPGGIATSNWQFTTGASGSGGITTYGATYSRVLYIATNNVGCSGSSESVKALTGTASNYWSYNVRSYSGSSASGSGFTVYFYNQAGTNIWGGTMSSAQFASCTNTCGLWELSVTGGQVYARLDGVDKGILGGTISETPYYIGYSVSVSGTGCGSYGYTAYIDDVTTSGYISGLGTESTSHILTESNSNTTDVSYSINTFPFADYTNSSYRNVIQKYTGTTQINIINTTIKNATQTGIYSGFTTYNRKGQLTSMDTNYGLYFSYTQKNNVTVASDYFFLQPPGAANSVTADTTAVIGQQETVSYSIGAPDFSGSTYSINIYSLSALVKTSSVTSTPGTVSWDTTGNSAGLYFITLSKTTSGIQTDIAYTTITLSSTLLIRGKVYDAQNATVISSANLNFLQGATWYNTTTAADGSYNLSGLFVNVLINVNASKTGYKHDNFTFTPLSPQIYTLNLYMISNGLNCSVAASTKTCIVGMTEDYPYHQAILGATVNLGNGSYYANTTSNSTTGFYIFNNLSDDNLTYTVNATKANYKDSSNYNITTLNQTFKSQIIIMNAAYTLTIMAQDSTNTNTILNFVALFNGTSYNTSTGQVIITGISYGSYATIVSTSGYLSSSLNVLVDSTKIQVFLLAPILPGQSSTIFKTLPHDVTFIVQDLSFNKKPSVYVTAQGFNTTVGNFGWLASLLGIDFNAIPINNVSMNGTTGTDGSVDFKMDGSIYYELTFRGGGIANQTWSGYPTAYSYIIIVPTILYGIFTNNTNEFDTIHTTVATSVTNASSAKIFVNYSDVLNQTSGLKIYLNQSIAGDPNNQTNLQTLNGSTNATYNGTFTVSGYAGQSYIVTFTTNHATLGTVSRSYGVAFPAASPLSYFDPISSLMMLFGLILFFAGFWGQTSTEQGSAVIVGLVWLLSGMGLFVNINLGLSFYLGLTLATVIAILMNINARARKEGMS